MARGAFIPVLAGSNPVRVTLEDRIGVLNRFEPGDEVTLVGVRLPHPPRYC